MIHGVNPNVQYVSEHIPHELPWLQSLNLELTILRWVGEMIEGFRAGPLGTELRTVAVPFPSPVPNFSDVELVISFIRIILELWWERHSSLFPQRKEFRGHSIWDYDISQGVSLQLPLHRVLASFLSVCTLEWKLELFDLLKLKMMQSTKFVESLMEEPLRIQVFITEISADLWVRNGWSMHQLSHSYRTSTLYSPISYHKDIFILQGAAALLPFDRFFAIALDRFKLNDFFDLQDPKASKTTPKIAEGFLSFLITILTDRTLIGSSHSQITRRYLIHRLAIHDATHSELVEEIPKPWSKLQEFDDILEEVAVYTAPSRSNPTGGKFSLKESCWEEFEGNNFLHYTTEELQEAFQRFQDFAKKRKDVRSFPQVFPMIHQVSLPPAFQPLEHLVDSPTLHNLIFSLLFSIKNKHSFVSELLISQTLQLIHYSAFASKEESKEVPAESIPFPSSSFLRNVLHLVNVQGKEESILSLLSSLTDEEEMKEHSSHIKEILRLLSQRDPNLQQEISKLLKDEKKETVEDASEDKSERLRKMRERQQRILQRFAAQQQAFQGTVDSHEEEVVEEELPTCCLCRDTSKSNEDNPIALVSYAYPDRSVLLTNRFNRRMQSKVSVSFDGLDPLEAPEAPQVWEDSITQVENSPGVAVTNCGHFLHAECFRRYFASLVNRSLSHQVFEGRGVIKVEEGEFLCPTCRTISNTLLPVTDSLFPPKDESLQQSHDVTSFQEWKDQIEKSLTTPSPSSTSSSSSSSSPLKEILDGNLCQRIFFQQENRISDNPKQRTFAYWNSIAYTLSHLEVVHRSMSLGGFSMEFDALFANSKLSKDLFMLLNGALWHQQDSFREERVSLFGFYWNLLTNPKLHVEEDKKGKEEVKEMKKEDIPLLSMDLFSVLVRMVFCLPREKVHQSDALFLIRSLFPAVVLQGIVSVILSPKLYFGDSLPDGKSEVEDSQLNSIFEQVEQFAKKKTSLTATKEVKQRLKDLSLPFLRRSILFLRSLSIDSPFARSLENLAEEQEMNPQWNEFQTLASKLELETSIEGIFQPELVTRWLENLFGETSLPKQFLVTPLPRPLQLFPLDHSFESMLAKYSSIKCHRCGKSPKAPAICLLCGTIVCINASCCKNEARESETLQHMPECGGRGLFFLPKDCAIFVARQAIAQHASGYFFPSTYLDKYGEDDVGFLRGKPLYLDTERYEQLRVLFLKAHKLDEEVVNSGHKMWRI